ncbi:hypothetical protein N7448_008367 [Penicillium atrosanguineum]|uniref:Tautomerase cis-CaaD-like domain-containing protein n=1 Tax=Penicillium atrosanguineum TaxID=1132637 RepID=A0A9W9GR12_9EURO|nr:uncharacterized protein N7443_000616 [Penicillium atrosanguineum]KAJ5127588.1 hypothetical protein N7448_008367 [Penicillium atrosanguineum]KAJ5313732.1 hypothetical protein N7443_000616 [Penicillium atrosanguineum]KAJ5330903.1 hypothetical protein N7476_000686 [Penicillium atrosanguineum]
MPLYDIEHISPLPFATQEQLAIALTNLHATRFNTPRCFVNVRFTDVSSQIVFRGGKLRRYNRVIIRTRAGSNRTNEIYVEHCKAVVAEWEQIVGKNAERGLRTVWVMGALTTALEAGIARPKTGEEEEWLVANRTTFEKLAEEGDEDFIELLAELDGE